MTLGYCMEFCGTCSNETNHRIIEQNGRTKKECVTCHEQVGSWSQLPTTKLFLSGRQNSTADRSTAA